MGIIPETISTTCLKVGAPAPDFTLITLDGPITLSDFAGRQNVLVYAVPSFIASRYWLGVMALGRLTTWLQRQDTTALLIGGDLYLGPAARLASELGLKLPILIDVQNELLSCYGLDGVGRGSNRTVTVLIDKQSVTRYFHQGSLPGVLFDEPGLIRAVKALSSSTTIRTPGRIGQAAVTVAHCSC